MLHGSHVHARLAGLLGLLALALAVGASSSQAATIKACVNKRSGSARIVSSKAKCKKSERRVSWNTTGPAGVRGLPGAAGANGTAGTNGAGPDYASAAFGPTTLTSTEKGVAVVSKTIPAGSYLVSGETIIGGEAESANVVGAVCELVDTAGTPVLVELPRAIDVSEFFAPLGKFGSEEYEAAGTMALQGQLTTTQPTTLALICGPVEEGSEVKLIAAASKINALQTTVNE